MHSICRTPTRIATAAAAMLLSALSPHPAIAADPEMSRGWYRIPYANGTDVKVSNDHLTHKPPTRIDLKGTGGSGQHRVVAAAAGRVRFVVDSFSEKRPDGNPCNNNYVWIEHPNGEWTKYSHFVKNSVSRTAGIKVGDQVQAGTFLGLEGDVGCATGVHLHFEVGVPADPADPIDSQGFLKGGSANNRIPRICGIKGNKFVDGQTVEATGLLPGAREVAHHGVPSSKYQALFDRVASCGYRLDWIDGFAKGGDVFYNIVFRPNPQGHGWVAFHGLTGAQYQQRFDEWVGEKKLRPTHVDSYAVGGELRYAAVFEAGSGPALAAYHGVAAQQHQQRFDDLTKDGFVPQVLSVASVGGQRRFTGVYVKQSVGAFEARQALTAAQYQAAFDANAQAGRRLTYLNAYEHGGQPNFSAIWAAQPPVALHARHGLSRAQYQQEWQQSTGTGNGMTTQAVTGYVDGGKVRYAAFWTRPAAQP